MLAYANLGTNDIERAKTFYDAVLGEMGASMLMGGTTPSGGRPMIGYGRSRREPMLIICHPFDGEAASVGNGVMIALSCASVEEVNKVHAKALSCGGADEGAPGPRGESGFYCGYFRDPDGNKLNAFCYVPRQS